MNDTTTLDKLESMLNKSYQHGFDEEEIEVLHRVINMVRGMDTLGSLAGFIQKSIIWFGAVIGAFVAVRTGFADYILQVVRG